MSFSSINDNKFNYTISVDGSIIFNGKTYVMPGEKIASFNITRIARDYLSSKINFSKGTTTYQQTSYKRKFEITPKTADGKTYVELYNDWSYEQMAPSEGLDILSKPLSYIVDTRQLLFVTLAKISEGEAMSAMIGHCQGLRCYVDAEAYPSPCLTFAIPLKDIKEDVELEIKEGGSLILARYRVKKTCAQYCLYYLNAYGGYDHLLINGNVMRTDTLTRTQMTRDVENTTLAHGVQTLTTEAQRTWKLHTDCLTDAQWALTHHLLGSTHVLLHDLATDEIIPVNIKNNQAAFNTYRNQGNKLSNLTIEVEEAHKRMRK